MAALFIDWRAARYAPAMSVDPAPRNGSMTKKAGRRWRGVELNPDYAPAARPPPFD